METLDPRICNEYDKLLHDFNNISVDSNTKLLKEIIDKLNNLENKIDKIITEKDNIINDLKDELTYFKEELKDLKNYKNNNSKNNDYFC